MAQQFDCLRPDDPRPDAQRALRVWLAFQRHFVFRPLEARAALIRDPEPARALNALRVAMLATEAEVAAVRDCGASLVPFGSALYPERLARLEDAPAALFVRGDPRALLRPGVAIVGARAATAYGRATARRFAGALADAGVTVISGLATGIDGEAHAESVARGGASIAVQACGPERVYPPGHARLARLVAESGAVVTEFPVGTPPRAPHFPLRNRIISALGVAVLVVEARLRSGSLVTARHAADQGIDVWAVPGPIDAPVSAGTNQLLADGAGPALSPAALLAGLAAAGVALRPSGPEGHRAAPLPGGMQGRVLAALAEAPLGRDGLAEVLDLSPGQLSVALVELELAGHVREDRDGYFRRVSPPRDSELS